MVPRQPSTLLRIGVKRFGRFPHTLIVDGGKEFHSEYFETLVARYTGRKKTRPGAKPRFGSVIERLFGTTNTEFVYTLLGNTQAAKRPRQMTKDIDPKRQAVWTLGDLYEFLCEWAYEVYDQMEHPVLGQSPRDAFLQGLIHTGEREHRTIAYDDEFLMESSPTTRKGTAKVEPGRGIKIHGIYYSAPPLRQPEVEGTQVKVRYDPFDIGTAYAYVRRRWVRCVSQYHATLQGHTEKEMLLSSKEIRRQHQLHTANAAVTARRLADFLAQASAHEAVRQQRLRDLEARAVLEAIAGGPMNEAAIQAAPHRDLETTRASLPPLAPVDIATLPVFEEYR
jgi:putative transposase